MGVELQRHPHMRDARIVELIRSHDEARSFVETGGLQLSGQPRFGAAVCSRPLQGELEHPRGDAPAAPVALHRHAPHLGPSPILEQSQGGDHPPATRLEGDHVLRLAVAPVQLLLPRHALLATEDPLAHRHRAPQLLGRAGPADGDRKGLHDSARA